MPPSLPKDGNRRKGHLRRAQPAANGGENLRRVHAVSTQRSTYKGRGELLPRSCSPVQLVAVKIPAGARSCKVNTSEKFPGA